MWNECPQEYQTKTDATVFSGFSPRNYLLISNYLVISRSGLLDYWNIILVHFFIWQFLSEIDTFSE
jgi:ABC-type glycerol-3-phosphate transport system permease component